MSLKDLKAILSAVNKKKIEVGVFETSHYPDGTPVALVASVHEYGSHIKGIPPRPFMRPTAENKKKEWGERLAHVVKTSTSNAEINTGLEAVGLSMAGDVRETITDLWEPALSEKTLDHRFNREERPTLNPKPLIDTGQLLSSITSKVGDK